MSELEQKLQALNDANVDLAMTRIRVLKEEINSKDKTIAELKEENTKLKKDVDYWWRIFIW